MKSQTSAHKSERSSRISDEEGPVQAMNALGLILTCINRACRFRAWKELGDVPSHVTVPMLEKIGRCRHCGQKGASVEVVQKVWVMSKSRSDWDAVNVPHRRRMREYIDANPFPKSGEARQISGVGR
jgi:hypothetical protein